MVDVSFSQSTLNGYSGPAAALQWGPDGRLYVAERFGTLKILTVEKTNGAYNVTATETVSLVANIPNHNDDGSLNTTVTDRQVTGIVVGGTAANPVVYMSSSDPRIGAGGGGQDTNLDTNSGIISRLTIDPGTGAWTKVDIVRGLPRSEENHATNGLELSPDGMTLYVAQGGHTNAGAPSTNFAGQPEYAYSAAILKVDLAAIEAMPIQGAATANPYIYDLPTLDDPNRPNDGTLGNENPDGSDVSGPFGGRDGFNMAKITADSPVQVYSPGYRNSYDVLLTEDGKLFTYDNGANNGWGGRPVDSNGNVVVDPSQTALNVADQDGASTRLNYDQLHLITAQGYYGGHPNPIRAAGAAAGLLLTPNAGVDGSTFLPAGSAGLPSDFSSVIPTGTADSRQGVYFEGGFEDGALDTGQGSVNGLAEYTASTTWNNGTTSIQGALLATDLNGYLYIIPRNTAGGVDTTTGGAGEVVAAGKQIVALDVGLPLGIDAIGDGKPFAGTIWIAALGDGQITILEPGAAASPNPDLDGDGLNNTVDHFALDPDNGTAGTDVISAGETVTYNFESGSMPGTFGGAGFTGAMTNGVDAFVDGGLYNSDNIIAGGAGGVVQLKNVQEGDAAGTENKNKDALQFGVTLDPSVSTAAITLTMSNWIPNATSAGGLPSAGLQIGTGDQDNFIKLVLGAGGTEAGHYTSALFDTTFENGGNAESRTVTDNALLSAASATWVQLRLAVDVPAGTVTSSWRFGTGVIPSTDEAAPFTTGTTFTLPDSSPLLQAVRGEYSVLGQDSGLAIGLIGTSNNGAPFTADFDGITLAASGAPPTAPVAINAGGSALTQDGIAFLADQFYNGGSVFTDDASGNGLQPVYDGTVYKTERFGDFSYNIPVADVNKAYTVELRFAEIFFSNSGERVFDVTLENQLVLDDLDILARSGGVNAPYVFTSAPVMAGANGTLDLQFISQVENPSLSAIVVREAPTGEPDTSGPTVESITVQEPSSPAGSATVTVVYNDVSGIDLDSIAAADLAVTGPSAAGAVTLQTKQATSSTSATAVYLVEAPAAGWADGLYSATVKAGEVADSSPAANTNLASSQPFTVATGGAGDLVIAINSGGQAYMHSDGTLFEADTAAAPHRFYVAGEDDNGVYFDNDPIANTTADPIYQSERFGEASDAQTDADDGHFGYAIRNADGSALAAGQYHVTLHFAEIVQGIAAGGRQFDIDVEGTATSNYDIWAAAGGGTTAVTLEQTVTVTDGTLDITFSQGAAENPKVNAVEVRRASQPAPIVGAATLQVTANSDDVQVSNFGSNSFQITNSGNKVITEVRLNVAGALYPDTVFDPFGAAGDTISKPLTIDSDGGTGVTAPTASSYLGSGGAAGFEGIVLSFDPAASGGFQPGETIGFSVDMDPNSVAGADKAILDSGATPPWDVGGVSGAELIGSTFTVTFADGTSAVGQLHGAGNQGGSMALASQSASAATVSLEIDGLAPGSVGTRDADGPIVVVSGPSGQTARIVMTKGFIQPIENNFSGPYQAQLDQQLDALRLQSFPANNAAEFQTVDVLLNGQAQDISGLFNFGGVAAYDFPGEDRLSLGFVAAVIDPVSKLAVGPLTTPTYLVSDNVAPTGSSTANAAAANAAAASFAVTFSEGVTGVDVGDFVLSATGTAAGTIADVSGSGSTYTVSASGITGTGTLALALASGATITDAAGNSVAPPLTASTAHTVDRDGPAVSSITLPAGPTNAASLTATVTFAEGVTGVDVGDFVLTTTGSASATIASLSSLSGSSYEVILTGVAGYGTLRLDLKASSTGIADAAGNAIAGGFTGGSVASVDRLPPDTTITGGPAALTSQTSAQFDFQGSDSGGVAGFEVSLDGSPFAAATSGVSYAGLSDGAHTFRVRAIDTVGNLDATPASFTWTIDTIAPVAASDSYQAMSGSTLLIAAAAGVLANDTDARPLTAVLDASPAHGTLALNSDGSFSYLAQAGYSGPDSFTYFATDGVNTSGITTVNFTVTPPQGSAGPDTLTGGPGADTLSGLGGDDVLIGAGAPSGQFNQLNGGEGSDTASYLGTTAAVNADLRTGKGFVAGVDTDRFTSIENLTGGSGNDILIGNGLANVLSGAQGNDALYGLDGDDILIGGPAAGGVNQLIGGNGTDTASYIGTSADIYVDLGALSGRVKSGSQFVVTDALNTIENLTGGSGNDVLIGNQFANVLAGGAGNDVLKGLDGDDVLLGGGVSGGRDQLWGGNGSDTASYEGSSANHHVDLGAQAGYLKNGSQFVLIETMNSIENITGGAGADTLIGTNLANTLKGGSGNDVLHGLDGDDLLQGGAGNDQLWGGNGSDWADYSDQTLAVTINLANQTASGAGAGADTFNAVENARGGAGIDTLRGSDGANRLEGGGARDILYGQLGADVFVYRAASDSRISTGYDTIADFQTGTDKLDLSVFGITTANVKIAMGTSTTSLYADVDGVAGYGSNDLAIAFAGANAITASDVIF